MKMVGYEIARWDECFENHKTRILKHMTWVPFPNKHDGDGYTELVVGHENGAAHYGAWCALVQVASKCDPRGKLVRDGHQPHDFASLSRKTRIPAKIIEEALPRLVSIGWVKTWRIGAGIRRSSGTIETHEQNRREGKGIEVNPPTPLSEEQKSLVEEVYDMPHPYSNAKYSISSKGWDMTREAILTTQAHGKKRWAYTAAILNRLASKRRIESYDPSEYE